MWSSKKLNEVLNVNANKCSFGVKEITYMGYIITKDGVKPDPENIQWDMDLKHPPVTTKVFFYVVWFNITKIYGINALALSNHSPQSWQGDIKLLK